MLRNTLGNSFLFKNSRTVTGTITFLKESNYAISSVSDTLANINDNLVVLPTSDIEDCILQGLQLSASATNGVGYTVTGINTSGMTGSYNFKIIVI